MIHEKTNQYSHWISLLSGGTGVGSGLAGIEEKPGSHKNAISAIFWKIKEGPKISSLFLQGFPIILAAFLLAFQ